MKNDNSSVREKAIQINSSDFIYGTVAEIGAGQETARWFFRTRGASNTLAKAMSAYDMQFSDAIYGREDTGRYVCESRLKKMLSHEYNLLVQRLDSHKGENSCFFAFSNTVAARSRRTGNRGHGWLGVRWQSTPRGKANEIRIHVQMLDDRNISQQEALGIIGINLIYAAFFFSDHPYHIPKVLGEDLEENRIKVDYIHLEGPDVGDHNPNLLNLTLIKEDLTEAIAFNENGAPVQPTEFLYGKRVLHYRGQFRPLTKHHIELYECADKQVKKDFPEEKGLINFADIDYNEFAIENSNKLNENEFLMRHDILRSHKLPFFVTNIPEYYQLQEFLEENKVKKSYLIIEIERLEKIFSQQKYKNLRGGLLEGLGSLLRENTSLLVCPSVVENKVIDALNFAANRPYESLINYLLQQKRIIPTQCLNESNLQIKCIKTVQKIIENDLSWKDDVPPEVAEIIEKNGYFKTKI